MKTTQVAALLCALIALTARAQLLEPVELFRFPRGPEKVVGGLALGPDGSFYGTSSAGGENNWGTVFRVTTHGTLTTLLSIVEGAQSRAALSLGNDGNFYGTTSYGGGSLFRVTTNGTMTTLVGFSGENGYGPQAALTLGPDGHFYGTTESGGSGGLGTVFRVTTSGSLTTLVSFHGDNGAYPRAALVWGADGYLYGTTGYGGANPGPLSIGYGTVFKMSTNGTFTTLVSFDGNNGEGPRGLTLGSDDSFYGTTAGGGAGYGTVFNVTTNGVLTPLVSLDGANGRYPGALTLGRDGNFYGTTYGGGANPSPSGEGYGTVFRVTADGILTTLVSFNNEDGAHPDGRLALGNEGDFYGTTYEGGIPNLFETGGYGTVFRVTTEGALTTLVAFGNQKGAHPNRVTLGNDGHFYGMTQAGGNSDQGTVFQITTNGGLTTLVSFDGANGATPSAALTLGPDGDFYGTTQAGGDNSRGTVFRLANPGELITLASFGLADGAGPGDLTLGPDSNFYGTTHFGGRGYGTIFRVTLDGGLTTLVSFNKTNGEYPSLTLTLGPDGNLYGTTTFGGPVQDAFGTTFGTVFKVTPDGELTSLHEFNGDDGRNPVGALTLGNDGCFYGATTLGGAGLDPGGIGYGTVFKISTDGILTTVYSFDSILTGSGRSLQLGSDGNFIGTTAQTVFHVTADGVLTTLASFDTALREVTRGPDGNFYGTTAATVTGGVGTFFRLGPLAPAILSQPQPTNQLVPAGVNVTISAGVFGTLPLTYQWFFQGAPLPGATGAKLRIENVSPSMSGNYGLRVTNHLGYALSSNAVLTVLPALVTTLPPSGLTAKAAVLNGSATIGAATVAWFDWGTDTNYGRIQGVTELPSGTVTFSNVLSGLNGGLIYHYRLVASNSFGIAYGADRSFTVIGDPALFVSRAINRLTLSWTGPGFRLQSNTNLSNASGWTNVGGGGTSPVSITVSNVGNRFFRLRGP